MRKNGITRGVQSQEVCRITKNKARIDNTSVSRQTSFGGASEEILMDMLGVDRPWRISSFSKGMYEQSPDFRENYLRGEIKIELDIERTMYPCSVCGRLCKVHQYEKRCYSHMASCAMAIVLDARIPKVRCVACGCCRQIDVPWARPRVSYTKLLERQVFQFLCSMPVSEAAKHTGLTDSRYGT